MKYHQLKVKFLLSIGFILFTFSVFAGIAVGEIRGKFIHQDETKKFHGYFAFIEDAGKDFEPIATGLTDKYVKDKSAYLTTTPVWGQNCNAFLAFNANFFDPEVEYKPNDLRMVFGPLKVNGKLIAPVLERPDGKGNPAILFDKNGNAEIKMATPDDLKKAYTAVGAQWEKNQDLGYNGSLLIENGKDFSQDTLPVPNEIAPRTAVGLNKDKDIMIILMIEGRLESSDGVTLPELSKIMKILGAYNAINLDGGGSSTIYYNPSKKIPLEESLNLYEMLKKCKNKVDKTDSLLFSLKQLNSALPFSSQPSGGSMFESALTNKGKIIKESAKKYSIPSNQVYRPVAVNFGFRLK